MVDNDVSLLYGQKDKDARVGYGPGNRYTNGLRLATGFGGYFSIIAPGSLGPVLVAMDPPDDIVNPPATGSPNDIPITGLSLLEYSSGAHRMQRPANYLSSTDNMEPQGSVGFYTWKDTLFQGCTPVSTSSLQGLVCLLKLGEGRTYYHNSDVYAERSSYWWFVYDLNDLGAVADGTKQAWQIQPVYMWRDSVMTDRDANGFSGTGSTNIGGITFDPSTNNLYVQNLGDGHSGCCDSPPAIYGFQIASATADPALVQATLPSTVYSGQSATFLVEATGASALSYQWQRSNDSGSSWNNLPGNSSSYSFTTASTDDAALFRVIISDTNGSTTSGTALLTVIIPGPPQIATQPSSVTVASGGTATFSVTPVGNPAHFFYIPQTSTDGGTTWTNQVANGTGIQNFFTFANVSSSNNGTWVRFQIQQYEASGETTTLSNTAVLTVQ